MQSSFPHDLGQTLNTLRSKAGLKQADISKHLSIDTSRISRIETGDFSPSMEEIEAYLQAVGTELALDYLVFLRQEWKTLPRPPFTHPDRTTLWQAEQLLQRITVFDQPHIPKTLAGQADLYRGTVQRAADFLLPLSHTVAYIGDIGVGKTTFVCSHTNLLLAESDKAGLQHRMVLEAGAGGTTICEVSIRQGNTYGIQVDPLEDAEIYKLVGEFCAGLKSQSRNKPDGLDQEMGVSREIERALRNMTGLNRKRTKDETGKLHKHDPAVILAEECATLDELRAEVSGRLVLWKRLERAVQFDATSDTDGLQWLKETFLSINNGRDPRFSLPKRISIIVPNELLPAPHYEFEVVDTKGIDGISIRPDLQSFADDPRSLLVLCSKFNSAPDISIQIFLKHLLAIGQEHTVRERIVLLVLPRPEEAQAIKDETGSVVETVEEGYEIKKEQVEAQLHAIGVDQVSVYFSNVGMDNPSIVSMALIQHIQQLRASWGRQIINMSLAIENLIENQEREHAQIAQREVTKDLGIFLNSYHQIPNPTPSIHLPLIRTIEETNARTVWASARRKGSWSNLDVFYHLGSGGAADTRNRTNKIFDELDGIIKNRLDNSDLSPAHPFLQALQTNIALWRSAFLESVRRSGELTFRPALEDDREFWDTCEQMYGQGLPYRQRVAQEFQKWFADPKHQHLFNLFEDRVQKVWRQEFLNHLAEAVQQTPAE